MSEEMTDVEIKALIDNSIVGIRVTGEVQCHWIEPPVSQEEAAQRERFRTQLNAVARKTFREINDGIQEMLEEL